MTIAGCFLTPGGVVLGSDSTQTFVLSNNNQRHFNYAQKLFEIGESSTLGLVTWGWGGNASVSYRRLIAELADEAEHSPFASVEEAARRWSAKFWRIYSSELSDAIAEARELAEKPDEHQAFLELANALIAGFCIGGYSLPHREVRAYSILFTHKLDREPDPTALPINQPQFWGVPNVIQRVAQGIDAALFIEIAQNPLWTGSRRDLLKLIAPYVLAPPGILPIREAIDYMYSTIYTTCKGLKFSTAAPICGGPVELAVITSDRRFRWVAHKDMEEAISIS